MKRAKSPGKGAGATPAPSSRDERKPEEIALQAYLYAVTGESLPQQALRTRAQRSTGGKKGAQTRAADSDNDKAVKAAVRRAKESAPREVNTLVAKSTGLDRTTVARIRKRLGI